MMQPENRRHQWLLCALLGAAAFLAFLPALQCGFTNFDDPDYITLNTHIQNGVSWAGFKWAMTTGYAVNWHPLTWLSHMVDCQLYDLKPAGHHLTNILLHASNTMLLFLLLTRLTGAPWRCAWVAAIFALHPLRAESVVWVAERKDVLSTFFWMLTALAYVRYCEARAAGSRQSILFYILALAAFALGLMSKPMLVTLPCVLLLLDYWPLQRLQLNRNFSWGVVLEKIPFLAMAAADSVVTYLVQDKSGVVASLAKTPLNERLANLPVAYIRYLGNIFWPSGLAVFYGSRQWTAFQAGGSALILCAITGVAVWQWKTRPWLIVGWLWFVGMLVPTIGLVHVGNQSIADRYTYVPSVGISIIVAWGVAEWLASRPATLPVVGAVGLGAIAACTVVTEHQIPFWRTPVSLFVRVADVAQEDSITCYNIGCAVMDEHNYVRAQRCFERALRVADDQVAPSLMADIKNNLGRADLELGNIPGAVSNFESAIKTKPLFPQAYFNMGNAFTSNGQPDVAVECYQNALRMDQNPAIYRALSNAYTRMGDTVKAADAGLQAKQAALGIAPAKAPTPPRP